MPVAVQPADLIRETSSPPSTEALPARSRVLVVEDGRNAADILGMFFELEGHEVSVAYDGVEAVERSSAFRPQIIFLDIGMPRMDGLEAARQIRSLPGGREIVIVALSGMDQEEDKRHCTEAGIDCHLAKPVCPTELRAIFDRFRERLTNP